MSEDMYDKLLRIATTGIGEWIYSTIHYNRYEATPYEALNLLFEEYTLSRNDKLVDFGCGRGRVAFYIHNRFNIPVTGVEVIEKTYEQALENKAAYLKDNQHISAPVNFHLGPAEDYEIKPDENRFYFFNPFSVYIFKLVVRNILDSVKVRQRTVDLILYYPRPEYELFLKKSTSFKPIKEIIIPDTDDSFDKFLVYRYS
ncbi:MAG: SAM-dependent methyltransferase [Caldicoprobacterales bacterium]|jgi:SAM-dependent methyltransferase|nr:class I SAM-dependent methyltransferase [Clostridiales bacterium]